MQSESIINNSTEFTDADFSSETSELNETFQKSWSVKISEIVLLLNILLLPFLFGGVHENVLLIFRIVNLSAICFILSADYSTLKNSLRFSTFSGRTFLLLCLCLAFATAHSAFYEFVLTLGFSHPVLQKTGDLLRPQVTLSQLFDIYNCINIFVLCSYYIKQPEISSEIKTSRIINWIIIAGCLVALTAIAHWFYDNGKLFWTFSAFHEATSSRARWPFVNPNHLAIFLIAPYFLVLGRIQETLQKLQKKASSSMHRGNLALGDFLSRQETQLIVRAMLINLSALLIVSLAIIASLSRNAGFTVLIMSLFYLVRPARTKSIQIKAAGLSTEEEYFDSIKQRRVKKVKRSNSNSHRLGSFNIDSGIPILKKLLKLAGLVAFIWLIIFFLGERGGDLFKARLEYALLYTQDDMRWQMYSDSWPMLSEYLWLGTGLANWSALYPSYMNTGLSGMDPAYLHSDLLQLLIELGIPGLLIFSLLLLTWCRQAVYGKQRYKPTTFKPLLFSILSLVLCCSFEFPLRIPAISSLAMILLALGSSADANKKQMNFD